MVIPGMKWLAKASVVSLFIAPLTVQAQEQIDCEAILLDMGIEAPGVNDVTPGTDIGETVNPDVPETPGAPGTPDTPGNDDGAGKGSVDPEPTPEPIPTPPVAKPKPRPAPPPGNGNIALPTGSAAKCNNGIRMAQTDRASVNRAKAAKATLQAAARKYGIDWRMLAAVGVRETNFRNVDSPRPGDPGWGVFQLTNQPGVSQAQARNLKFSAEYAARLLRNNMRLLKRRHPRLTEAQLLQATFAAYNFGPDNISGNPRTIDVGTTKNNYGENILLLMNCF